MRNGAVDLLHTACLGACLGFLLLVVAKVEKLGTDVTVIRQIAEEFKKGEGK